MSIFLWFCGDMLWFGTYIETVVCLGREFDKSKEHVCLDYEPSPDIKVICAATYAEIKEWVIKEYGLKVSSLYVAQVKQKHGIIERENYNKPKAEGGKVPHCPPEKEAAIEAALRYFRMIWEGCCRSADVMFCNRLGLLCRPGWFSRR